MSWTGYVMACKGGGVGRGADKGSRPLAPHVFPTACVCVRGSPIKCTFSLSSSSSPPFSCALTCGKQGCKELTLLGHAGTKLQPKRRRGE